MKDFPNLVQPETAMPQRRASTTCVTRRICSRSSGHCSRTYHVDDPVTFYNGSDKWTVPTDPTDEPAATSRRTTSWPQPPAERHDSGVPADVADEGEQPDEPGGLHQRRQRSRRRLRQDDCAPVAHQFGDPRAGTDLQLVQLDAGDLEGHLAAQSGRVTGRARQLAHAADRQLVPLRRAAIRPRARRTDSRCCSDSRRLRRPDRVWLERGRCLDQPRVRSARCHRCEAPRRVGAVPTPSATPTPTRPRASPPPSTALPAGVGGVRTSCSSSWTLPSPQLQNAYKSGDLARIGEAQAAVQRLTKEYLALRGPTTAAPTPSPTR